MNLEVSGREKFEAIEVQIVPNFSSTYNKLKHDPKHISLNESEVFSSSYTSCINRDLPRKGFPRFAIELKHMS